MFTIALVVKLLKNDKKK
ncbi:hypothetical protein P7G31_09705 [Streptococcus parauberis]|uniref:Uncharacterized protein n=1 Tax=Streptococcus parauberis TaxID=1348 RepID=A0AAE4L4J6_9STRE|nr:hypothetical protein [Streptococcus parauberis]